MWIQISWLHHQPADLDQHFFQKRILNFDIYIHSVLVRSNMLQIHTELSQIPCMYPREDSVLLDHPSGLIRVYAVCSICSLGPIVSAC